MRTGFEAHRDHSAWVSRQARAQPPVALLLATTRFEAGRQCPNARHMPNATISTASQVTAAEMAITIADTVTIASTMNEV